MSHVAISKAGGGIRVISKRAFAGELKLFSSLGMVIGLSRSCAATALPRLVGKACVQACSLAHTPVPGNGGTHISAAPKAKGTAYCATCCQCQPVRGKRPCLATGHCSGQKQHSQVAAPVRITCSYKFGTGYSSQAETRCISAAALGAPPKLQTIGDSGIMRQASTPRLVGDIPSSYILGVVSGLQKRLGLTLGDGGQLSGRRGIRAA